MKNVVEVFGAAEEIGERSRERWGGERDDGDVVWWRWFQNRRHCRLHHAQDQAPFKVHDGGIVSSDRSRHLFLPVEGILGACSPSEQGSTKYKLTNILTY
jgi:hypothetical protein